MLRFGSPRYTADPLYPTAHTSAYRVEIPPPERSTAACGPITRPLLDCTTLQMRRRRRCIVTGLAHRSLRPRPARDQSEHCPRPARNNSRWPSRIAVQLLADAGATPGSGSVSRFHGMWRKTTGEWRGESTRRETLGSVGGPKTGEELVG
jgi:hypothetical protein